MNQRFLITSALPYINGVKHLGNLVGSMLTSDVYARFLRQQGHEVLLLCATDEHGTPAELAAAAMDQSPREYCDAMHERHADLVRRFSLSFDHFGRSSSRHNHELTQHFCERLTAAGLIEERTIQQFYSDEDQRFLPDRYVTGTCPHCGYEQARGDQCESCTHVLDPTELIAPRSSISGSENLKFRETSHLFLKYSTLQSDIEDWLSQHSEWPTQVVSIAKKWLKEGLRDRCITRDLSWGIPVNREGFENKVFYVWFDAPIAYIAATAEWADLEPGRAWRDWWWEADDVTYVQFMAKDNVPFHTVGFPATLMGSGEPWKTVDYLKGFSWLTYYGGKFSTSQQRGIFMDQALDLLPADYWRYYLIANAPESDDADFTWEHFASIVNKDLADVLGNFVNRTLKFCESKFSGQIPEQTSWGKVEDELAKELRELLQQYSQHLNDLQFRKTAHTLRKIWATGNRYFDDKQPWAEFRLDPSAAGTSINIAIHLIRIFAIVSRPIMPETSDKLLAVFGTWSEDATAWVSTGSTDEFQAELQMLSVGDEIAVPDVLFRKLDDQEITAWREQFGGGGL